MPDPDADTIDPPKDGKPGKLLEGKGQAQREKILVISGVGVLILTVLILRKQSAANASQQANQSGYPAISSNPTPGSPADASTATDPATGVPYAQEVTSLQSQVNGLSSGLNGFSSPTGVTPTSAAPTGGVSLPTSAPTPISGNPTSSGPSSSAATGTGGQGGSSSSTVNVTINGIPNGHPTTTQKVPGQ